VELHEHGEALLGSAEPGPFELLILDLGPDFPSGLEHLASLRERGIEIPVLRRSSRFPARILARRGALPRLSFLLKPFSFPSLKRAIQESRRFPGLRPEGRSGAYSLPQATSRSSTLHEPGNSARPVTRTRGI